MTVRHLTLDGREYVLIPRKHWETINSREPGNSKPLKQPHLAEGRYTIDHVRISLANKVASRRKAAGLTQQKLAQLAQVRIETINRLEKGLHMPSARTFEKIERALNRMSKRPAA